MYARLKIIIDSIGTIDFLKLLAVTLKYYKMNLVADALYVPSEEEKDRVKELTIVVTSRVDGT